MKEVVEMNSWIAEALSRKGISQRELARRIGIAPETLNRKLKGKEELRYWEVARICAELDIDNPLPLFETKKLSEMR